MNDSRTHGLLRLARLREHTEAKAEEVTAKAERFAALKDPGAAPTVVSSHQLFQTPADLADRLAGLLPTVGRTLEPSAGLGRLYTAIRKRSTDNEVVLVDLSAECCRELYRMTEGDEKARIVQGDFLEMDAKRLGGLFDSIIANPPFKQGADIKHVFRMLSLLAPGGTLVSLCANGPRQRVALQPLASQWIELPAGTFREEGTRVDVAIVVIQKEGM